MSQFIGDLTVVGSVLQGPGWLLELQLSCPRSRVVESEMAEQGPFHCILAAAGPWERGLYTWRNGGTAGDWPRCSTWHSWAPVGRWVTTQRYKKAGAEA